MVGFIYEILHIPSGRRYIGSTNNIKRRFVHHKCELRANRHCNQYLQNLWNKYKEDDFKFSILETIEIDKLLSREQELISTLPDLINIAKDTTSPMRGRFQTQIAKDKISKHHKGKVLTEKTKKLISLGRIGKYGKEKNPAAKINSEIAQVIRNKYEKNKISQEKLGNEFGISQQAVSLIVNNLGW